MAENAATNRIRTRAMNRALAKLRDRHRPEYEDLLKIELEKAYAEAKAHTAQVRQEHPGEKPPPRKSDRGGPHPKPQLLIPPRLMPGTRSTPVLRDDVARCPYCQKFHDRGHECSACRSKPMGAPPRDPYARPPESAHGVASGLAAG